MNANFRSENLKGRDRFEELGVDGRIIIKHLVQMGSEVWDWQRLPIRSHGD
jgi:hypothetical protein